MKERKLTEETLMQFRQHLEAEEKSPATVEKYVRDVVRFGDFAGEEKVTKETVIAWKRKLQEEDYAPTSINSMLASLNSLLKFLGWQTCRVRSLRIQRQTYLCPEKELNRDEYLQLLKAAEGRPQLKLVMETICGTGIRVSELCHFTVEAANRGEVRIQCKGKMRTILIPAKLRKLLLRFARQNRIATGIIFQTRSGRPVNRSNIWAQMKNLCEEAGVSPSKVFPHNLRKLFARAFYRQEKDIAQLADVLGHSSINTTRIYIMSSGTEHRRKIDRLGLVV